MPSISRSAARMLLLGLLAGLLPACGANRTSDKDLQFVSPGEGRELVRGGSRLFGLAPDRTGAWVDPRTEREFLEGHIPGAVHLPFQNLSAEHRRLRAWDILVVYGNDFRDPKSEGMSKRLIELGFKDVYTLEGGMRAWREDEQPVAVGTEEE